MSREQKVFLFACDMINSIGYRNASTSTFARRRAVNCYRLFYCEFCHRMAESYEILNANNNAETNFETCTRCIDEVRLWVDLLGPQGIR